MRRHRAGAAAVVAVLVSCGGSSAPTHGPVSAIQIVSGNRQTGFAGEELPDAVVVRVMDSAGAPVAGQVINFKVTQGGGSVFAGVALSDAGGMARERWTLGGAGLSPEPQKLEARAVDSRTGAAIVFATSEATAILHPPAGLTYSANPATYVGGVEIAPNTPSSGGGPALLYSISPALPSGLAMSPSTGVITGTPAAVAALAVYTVTATNSGGSATASLDITVSAPPAPVITTQPVSQIVFGMGTATFTVAASGTGLLSFQWQKNGGPIAGAASAAYAATPQSPADDGSVFTVVVSDAFGGRATSDPVTLTVRPGFWPTGSMATARAGHTATLLPGGTVIAVGGWANNFLGIVQSLRSAEVYDPAAGTFSATGSLAGGRYFHTATLLPSGEVLVVGGATGGANLGRPELVESYDPVTGTFTAGASLGSSVRRTGHTATLLPSGKVLVVGGRDGGTSASALLYE